MVFEAVVVELLNKFLKQYVENLDTSQLKIGIWGGDVVLKDLKIKSTLFDDLNLPIRIKCGRLGKLAMKIPWKNLYSSQVVVEIHELLVICIPNVEFKYDANKEEKWIQEKKQARLRAIEEAKKQETQTDATKQSDGFVEKLVTQITKNLQVVIKHIHIRYEDKSTIPGSPFSVGVTLCHLSALTTLSDPTKNFSELMMENKNFICKVVNLEGVSIYWNSKSVLFSDLPENKWIYALIDSIPEAEFTPQGFVYMFGPLSASAFVRLNPKPELDGSNFTIPKVFVNVHLKEIELAVTHNQFSDAMAFLQEFQRYIAASKYRKYRPVGITVIGHAREWWWFAYTAILEDIVRRKKEWNWEIIKNHRVTCRKYAELYKTKISGKKMTTEEARLLSEIEKKLNVFNLVLIREKVNVEVARIVKEPKSGGWFSGWFGGTDSKAESNDDELVQKIQKVMTVEEKQKLYTAIGYEESAPPTKYPITFVVIQFWFHLDEIKATVYDDLEEKLDTIMTLSVKSVRMEFEQRAAASSMKFVMIIGNILVKGKEKDPSFPEMISSSCKVSESWIEFLYEKKPPNATCDQRIILNTQPLRIIYHAATINLLRDIFVTDSGQNVEKIVAAHSASLPTFQRITSLGLQYAIEKRTELEVKVNIMSSELIIPYGGVYHKNEDMLVLLLGKLSVETEDTQKKNLSVKKLFLEGTTDEEIFSTAVSASYTNFKCNLTGVQVLFQLAGEDWVAASQMQRSSLQFLEPTNLEVVIKKSLVMDDARIPKMIIEGKMPSLAFNFQEERLVNFVALALSIPTETEKNVPLAKKGRSASNWSLQSIGAQLENKLIQIQKELAPLLPTEYTQGIDLVGRFQMNEFVVTISKTKVSRDVPYKSRSRGETVLNEMKFLNLKIVNAEVDFTYKTFESIHLFKLGGIEFLQYQNKDWVPFVSTKLSQEYLCVVEYISLNTRIPDFYTAKGGVVNRLTLNITPVNVLLEKEALLSQVEFVQSFQRRVNAVKETFPRDQVADAGKLKGTIFEESSENAPTDKKVITKGKRFRRKTAQKEVIDFFLQASIDEIHILVEYKGEGLTEFSLKNCSVDLSTQKSYMTVDVSLGEICLLDLNTESKHSKILASLDKQTLTSRVTLFNKEYYGSEHSLDMSIEAEVGRMNCTFVALFFSRAIEFMGAFQSQIETLKEGMTIAAEKAKENVVKAFHNAAEICVKIQITAPILIIPESSVSMNAIVVDLGVLTVKNAITELDCTPEARKPLIETMKVHLQNLKVYRSVLKERPLVMEQEKNFLVPVTFELTVKRNLSTSWFKAIPEVEIFARLATVLVTLTHEDLNFILNGIRQNIHEGDVAQFERRSSPKRKVDAKPQKPRERLATHLYVEEIEKREVDGSPKYHTMVKFVFFMDSFVFDAMDKNAQQEEIGLARFVLERMSLKGRLFSNNSIHTTMMLGSCILEDKRPGKDGRLTRLMQTTEDLTPEEVKEEGGQKKGMIQLVYQKKENDCFVFTLHM